MVARRTLGVVIPFGVLLVGLGCGGPREALVAGPPPAAGSCPSSAPAKPSPSVVPASKVAATLPPITGKIAAATTAGGELVVTHGEGKLGVVLRTKGGDETRVLAESATPPAVILRDFDDDGRIDLLWDRGAQGKPARFAVHYGDGEGLLGDEEPYAFRDLAKATDLSSASALLASLPKVTFSQPEACGAIDRAKLVEAWTQKDERWVRAAKKGGVSWSCGHLEKDGPNAYWMPQLVCSAKLPVCEAGLVSGGPGGTTRPDTTLLWFERTKVGLLVVTAVAYPAL